MIQSLKNEMEGNERKENRQREREPILQHVQTQNTTHSQTRAHKVSQRRVGLKVQIF